MKRSEMLKLLKGHIRSVNSEQLSEYLAGDISLGKLVEHLAESTLDCVENNSNDLLVWDEE